MVTNIGRVEFIALIESGVQIVDVLPESEYSAQHIPGAIGLPLEQLTAETLGVLRRDEPVVVYCHDGL